MNPIPLYEMFPFIKESDRLATDLTDARVTYASVNPAKTKMEISLTVPKPIPPYELGIIENLISNEFEIKTVTINAASTSSDISPNGSGFNSGGSGNPGGSGGSDGSASVATGKLSPQSNIAKPIMGRVTKTKPTPMGEISLDDGKVTIRGEVFLVRSRKIEKSNSWVLDFDMTDHTGSINVSSFMPYGEKDNAEKIINSVKKGMSLTVSGTLHIKKFDSELTLVPTNIFPYQKEQKTDTAEEKRVELHLHTKMSAMDALTDIEDVIKRAVDWGHPAIAITDHGVVHSFPVAAGISKSLGDKIKILYGVEGYFRNDETAGEDGSSKRKRRKNNHIVILVKNQTGIKNLYKLITKSHIEFYDGRPIIYKSLLEKHREGLLISSACEAGEVFRAIINQTETEELHRIARFYDYLEIMPICNNMFMLYEETPKAKNEDELRAFNKEMVKLGETLGIPVVATGDVHFLNPEDEIYRTILQNSRGFSDADSEMPLYFKTTDEMLLEFSYLGEEKALEVVVKNPQKIADMCENVNPLPPSKKLFPPMLEGSAQTLENLVLDKTRELYGENPHELIIKRIEYELNDILRLEYDVIYIAAQKIVAYLKEQGSRVGSRGSIGSSFVAHLAGITEVNPLPSHYLCPKCKTAEFPTENPDMTQGDRSSDSHDFACGADMPDKLCPNCSTTYIKDGFNIRFETFMGFDGEKVPDIDLNIANEHLSISHKFTSEMFGNEYVFRAGTIGTVQERNAFRFVKEYLEKHNRTATKAEENRLITGCVGVKQTTGQHPGGLIVIPQNLDVTDFSPAHYPSDDKEKGTITLHFEYRYIEDNLIKLDLLGHDNPTMLRMLEGMTGINADDIDLGDPQTMAIFSSPMGIGISDNDKIIGETGSIGIPEFGTPFTRQMLSDTKPDNFDMLVRLSGYSHGEGVWAGNAKELILSKKATVDGTISSRDDIMLYLISKGMQEREAYKISESVRKGRGLPEGTEKQMQQMKIPSWYIESAKKIEYLFPKAHAVAYVMMAFRIAWFKVHKPLEFYSAHFYRRRKSFDAELMTQGIDKVRNKINELNKIPEAKAGKGKEGELLTTLESCYEYYLRGFSFESIDLYESAAESFLIINETTLRPPFLAVSGLGETAARTLEENRKGKTFISIDEISAACPGVNKTNLDKLKQLGALKDLPDSSQMSLF
ncbi:MAG: PolC-type DNA polymerase III [Oscillospiraceae bacterium]|nr:PolC-type DNA polymerase III [Oscillospiraceae bacterium]